MRVVKREVDLQRRAGREPGAGLQTKSSLGVPHLGTIDAAVRSTVLHAANSIDRITAA